MIRRVVGAVLLVAAGWLGAFAFIQWYLKRPTLDWRDLEPDPDFV